MKKINLILSFIVLLAAMTLLVGCQEAAEGSNSYVTLDINPSIELIVSPKNKVLYANPLNEDAEILLANLDLKGMDLEDAVDLIIETAIELGYISVDESTESLVLVSTVSKDEALKERIHNKVKQHLNQAFEKRGMLGKAKDKDFNPDFILEAETYGVTPGHLFIAKKLVELKDTLTLEEVLEMSKTELLEAVKEARKEAKEVVFEIRDQFFDERDAVYALYRPQMEDLRNQILNIENQINELNENEDAEALKTALQDAKDQLNRLRIEFHEALAILRNQFHEQSNTFRNHFMEEKQRRRAEFHEHMSEFKDELEQRKERMRDRIRDYQEEKDKQNNPKGGK